MAETLTRLEISYGKKKEVMSREWNRSTVLGGSLFWKMLSNVPFESIDKSMLTEITILGIN